MVRIKQPITYRIDDEYLVIRIKRRNALKTKIRGYNNTIEKILEDIPEDERPLASVVIGLTLYRARGMNKYINLLKRSFYDPNMKRLLFSIAEYYVNMHTILQNLASKTATLIRLTLTMMY